MEKIITVTQKNSFSLAEVTKKIPKDYFVIFFAPVEYIDEVARQLGEEYNQCIGSSNFKNIHKNGCEYNSYSVMGIKVTASKTLMIKNVTKSPIRQYREIQEFGKLYKKGHSVLIAFTDGLSLAEENMLSVVNNELVDIPLIGGSAGDKGGFTGTKVSVGTECISDATALAIITTDMFIDVICENIYEPTDIKGIITRCDMFNRKLIEIEHQPATTFFAKKLNIQERDIPNVMLDHPIARLLGTEVYISSIMSINNDKSLNIYCRLFPNSYVSICKPIDYKELWRKAVEERRSKRYIGGMFVNCIFRTTLFEKDRSMRDFINYLGTHGEYICMTSYGEQFNKSHVNQTMTAFLFRER